MDGKSTYPVLVLRPAVLSHFSCVQLCDPVDYSPPGSSVHGDSPGQNAGGGCCLPGDLPDLRIELESLMSPALAGGFFYH